MDKIIQGKPLGFRLKTFRLLVELLMKIFDYRYLKIRIK